MADNENDLKEKIDELAVNKLPRKEVPLSDGRVALVRKAKGRDLERGAAVAKNPTNPMSLFMGVVAQVTHLDGKPLIYEELLDLDLADVMTLIGAVGGNVPGPSPAFATSSSSGDTLY